MTTEQKLREALESIIRYGLDTLSGRTDGPDDRDWQRAAVNEMVKRARADLAQPPAPEQQENEADELLRNLGLDPDRYRTEAGFINHLKVKAAIRHPDQYPQLAAPEQQAPQEGWKWVPVDPTQQMMMQGTEPVLWPEKSEFPTTRAGRIYRAMLSAAPAAPEAAKPKAVECYSFGGTTGINDYRMTDGSIKTMRPNEVEWAAKPETERAELPPLPDAIHTYEAHGGKRIPAFSAKQMQDYARAAILAADSKAGGEPVALPAITCKHSKRSDCAFFDATPDWVRLSDAIEESPPQGHTRPQQQAKPLTEIAEMIREAHDFSLDEMHTFAREKMLEAATLLDSSGIGDQA